MTKNDQRYSKVDTQYNATKINIGKVVERSRQYMRDAVHQLRAVPSEFTGRTSEIVEIMKTIREHSKQGDLAVSNISSFNGMGGVGKTALANVIGHLLSQDYPDAQIFIELRAHSANPVMPSQALAECIHSFDSEVELPDDETLLRNKYLSLFQNKRSVIILDDAASDDQVEKLLPPAGNITIITSRQRLTVGDSIPLPGLARPDSTAVLKSICQRLNDTEADKIANLCDDLPVALKVSAGFLKRYVSKPITEYISELQNDRLTRLSNGSLAIKGIFEASYQKLTLDQQRGFKSLSVMRANFNRTAGIAVMGIEGSADILDELTALNLLQYDELSQRFMWHDLLREFAIQKTALDEKTVASIRHAKHYIQIAHAAKTTYLEGNEKAVLGLQQFDEDITHFRDAFDYLVAAGSSNDIIALVDAAGGPSVLRFDTSERIRWLIAELEAAKIIDDRLHQGKALNNLGIATKKTGNIQQAISYYEGALKLAREDGNDKALGTRLGNFAIALADLGDDKKALEHYHEALELKLKVGNKRGAGHTLHNIGNAYKRLNDYKASEDYYEKALSLQINESGDLLGEAYTLRDYAELHILRQEFPDAIIKCKRVLQILEQLDQSHDISMIYNILIDIYKKTKNSRQIGKYRKLLDALSVPANLKKASSSDNLKEKTKTQNKTSSLTLSSDASTPTKPKRQRLSKKGTDVYISQDVSQPLKTLQEEKPANTLNSVPNIQQVKGEKSDSPST